MADGATQHAFSPTVLRERADRLDDLAEDLRVDCHSMHGNGVELGDWEARRSCCHWANQSVDFAKSATDLRLLADLLDAAPDLVESWEDMKSPMTSRNNHPHTAVPFMRHDAAVSAIAAVLEAHRD